MALIAFMVKGFQITPSCKFLPLEASNERAVIIQTNYNKEINPLK
jgi:hypothetical protein